MPLVIENPDGLKFLEKILKCLPEPDGTTISTSATVNFFGLDYSPIYRQIRKNQQIRKLISEVEISKIFETKIQLINLSKEKILETFKMYYDNEKRNNRYFSLDEVIWSDPYRRAEIKLDPFEIKISYIGEEPDYVTKIRNKFPKYFKR